MSMQDQAVTDARANVSRLLSHVLLGKQRWMCVRFAMRTNHAPGKIGENMFCDVELSNFGGAYSNWLFLLELWENDKTWLHHCFSGQWWGRANTGECVCGFMCFWYGMPPGFGFVCQVILLKKLDYSAYEGIMHLNFPIVCMHVLENVHDFCGTIVFLVTFYLIVIYAFCLFILIVLYFLFCFIYLFIYLFKLFYTIMFCFICCIFFIVLYFV